MPGQARYGINKLRDALKPLVEKGLKTVLIFGVPGNIIKVNRVNPVKCDWEATLLFHEF